MAVPTNVFDTYEQVGKREDITDVIYNVDPTDTPYITKIDTTEATARVHSWQTDSLDSPSGTNIVAEGDDATSDSLSATTLLSNTCQISDKVPRVSGTSRAIVTAGRKDELPYQIMKSALAIRRDMETSLTQNTAEVDGDATTPRVLGGAETWYTTNDSRGAGGADGGTGDSTATDGTQRVFTETLLKAVLADCADAGGDPDCILLGSFNKQKASGFTGNATREIRAGENTLDASIEVYKSDFGDLELKYSRFTRARVAHVIQTDMWATAYLRPVHIEDIAKTGDSDRRQIITEFTLESRNEAASGIIADLTTA